MKLENNNGIIAVSNKVIAAVAGHAATACFGVKGMTETSVKDGIVRLLKGEQMTKGVFVSPSEDGSRQPTPVFLPGEFHEQRSLVGYSPWGHRVGHD